MSLKGKYALITGSSRGIGRAIALKLAEGGAKIGVHYYKNIDAANDTLAKVRERRSDGFIVQADVNRTEFTLHMIHHSPNVIGPVYIRLNNEPVRAALPYFCERVIRGVNVLIVVNANLRAAFCQLQCYGPANPPRRSRDQGVLALQRHTVWPSFMRKSTSPDLADRPPEK